MSVIRVVTMWRAKVFEDTTSGSESDQNEELPAPKKKRRATKETDKVKKQSRKALLKTERQKLEGHVKGLDCDKISLHSFEEVRSQKLFKGEDIQAFCSTVDLKSLSFLAQHLQEVFSSLFNECSSKKERYLHFQISWQRHCSYLLVEKNQQLTQLGLHPSDPVAGQVLKVRSEWYRTVLIISGYFIQIFDAVLLLHTR